MHACTRMKPGSETSGMPASETSATTAPLLHPPDELGGALALVVLVVGDERAGDAVAVEQRARVPRVLARDHVGGAQRREHAQRDVLEVADRRRADDEPAAHDAHPPARRSRANTRRTEHSGLGAEARGAHRDVRRRAAPARARASTRRAGSRISSPAPITPPPTTTTSGLKMLTIEARPSPSDSPSVAARRARPRRRRARARVTSGPLDVAPVGERASEAAARLARRGRAGVARERGSGHERLEAAVARAAGPARGPVRFDDHVAELARRALRAAEELAADQDRAADAGAERQHHRDALAARGAVPVLGEQREVRVVVDEGRQPDALRHDLGEGHARRSAGAPRRRRARARRPSGRGCRSRPPRPRRRPRRAPRRPPSVIVSSSAPQLERDDRSARSGDAPRGARRPRRRRGCCRPDRRR